MRKTMSLIGIIISALLIVAGVLFMTGAFGGDGGYPSSATSYYDSGYANFGGDFYSYVNNNTAEAADAAYRTAVNVKNIGELLKNFCGILLMGMGAMGICFFSVLGCEKKEKNCGHAAPVSVPVMPVMPELPELSEQPAE